MDWLFNFRKLKLITTFLFVFFICSCKKFIQVDVPYTSFNGENVFTTDATAISAVNSLYVNMSSKSIKGLGVPSLSFVGGLSADELSLLPSNSNANYVGLYTNSLSSETAPSFWNICYQAIYQANAAIEGLSKSNDLTKSIKQQLLGECKFIRAFYYFYLVSLYGDVPLVLTTDYKTNSLISRTAANQVMENVIDDLEETKTLLSNNYVASDLISSTVERVRPNKWAATALLARAYLYSTNYLKAEEQASAIIENVLLFGPISSISLNSVFQKNSKEAIWQLQPVNSGWNTEDARTFILPSTGPNPSNYPVYISKRLQFSFEVGDLRKTAWMDSIKINIDTFYYAHKYKSATQNAIVTEYSTVLRLAEQCLIRAEARAQLGNVTGSQSDLNSIRKRAGLSNTAAGTKEELMMAILKERRFELFTEWGHRWFDLKRTGIIDSIMSVETIIKGGSWESKDKLYPLTTSELLNNPNLTQTPEY
jgi:starch-binding outer membrane protein, SusD/RagB family